MTIMMLDQSGIFYKFVINKDGKLENHFSSQVSPSSKKLISVLDEVIK